ncbi:target of rapamycin complex 2 subunit mapkap1 isoform x1 [Limosa lapponica baueri]|uniref:Target of rapamycin complex 2 subunit MAPKAP1 n=2 Tax=Neoaves TaxID=3078114 RepID=A0A2I0TVC9_LIMLA|nr:target of rapamycin complex 2 subunit mapkap1 isoform x1 [Limosa lapponica baueri]
MAFLDNPTIILAHIRQSHVTSDDTGMCEMVLIDHDVDLEKFNPSSAYGDSGSETQGSNGETQGYVYSQSVDITSSWDFGIRRRSNTAEELSSLFEKKNFRVKSPCSGKQSILSVRLEQCPLQLNNPFNEYSKFDGKGQLLGMLGSPEGSRSSALEQLRFGPLATGAVPVLALVAGAGISVWPAWLLHSQCAMEQGAREQGCHGRQQPQNRLSETQAAASSSAQFKTCPEGHVGTTATKKIDVYLPLHTSQDKLQPMTVVTIANAKVHDLIGLICWQYTSEGREPKLNDNVNAYCLHIAEDDGEVDTDFPPLDSNEPIHKFGFSTLALVEKYSSPGLAAKQSLFVRINAAHGFSLIQVDSMKVTMKDILQKALKRRKGSQRGSGKKQQNQSHNLSVIVMDSLVCTHKIENVIDVFLCGVAQEWRRPGGLTPGLVEKSPSSPDLHGGQQTSAGPQYRLEKQSEPNVPVDLDCTLESQSTLEFCLVRENSSRGEEVSEEDPQIDIATVQDMLSSHHYKSFKVSMIHRLRFTTDVQLEEASLVYFELSCYGGIYRPVLKQESAGHDFCL